MKHNSPHQWSTALVHSHQWSTVLVHSPHQWSTALVHSHQWSTGSLTTSVKYSPGSFTSVKYWFTHHISEVQPWFIHISEVLVHSPHQWSTALVHSHQWSTVLVHSPHQWSTAWSTHHINEVQYWFTHHINEAQPGSLISDVQYWFTHHINEVQPGSLISEVQYWFTHHINEVQPWFNGQDHARLQSAHSAQGPQAWFCASLRALWVATHVMCVDAHEVAKAMWHEDCTQTHSHHGINITSDHTHLLERFQDHPLSQFMHVHPADTCVHNAMITLQVKCARIFQNWTHQLSYQNESVWFWTHVKDARGHVVYILHAKTHASYRSSFIWPPNILAVNAKWKMLAYISLNAYKTKKRATSCCHNKRFL